jgi:hypothetical protein
MWQLLNGAAYKEAKTNVRQWVDHLKTETNLYHSQPLSTYVAEDTMDF